MCLDEKELLFLLRIIGKSINLPDGNSYDKPASNSKVYDVDKHIHVLGIAIYYYIGYLNHYSYLNYHISYYHIDNQ